MRLLDLLQQCPEGTSESQGEDGEGRWQGPDGVGKTRGGGSDSDIVDSRADSRVWNPSFWERL